MKKKMKSEKPRLRLTLNCILGLIVALYIVLVFMNKVNNYSILGYLVIFFGITIIRDIIAPKNKVKNKEK